MTSLKPLAERMRPTSLEHYFGQSHLVGPQGILRPMIEQQRLPSLIFWGPPGVGKTTLSEIIARSLDTAFYSLSAVHSGVKDVREVLERIQSEQSGIFGSSVRPILFIDEIHRFSKSQQDSLLAAVEQGIVTLIGATTENQLRGHPSAPLPLSGLHSQSPLHRGDHRPPAARHRDRRTPLTASHRAHRDRGAPTLRWW